MLTDEFKMESLIGIIIILKRNSKKSSKGMANDRVDILGRELPNHKLNG